jgi:predicted DNA-binding antitoxin AbrB/MazE fold protein
MYQAIEAVSKSGYIYPLEPIEFEENEQLIVLRLSKKWHKETVSETKDWRKFAGALKDSTAFEGDPVEIQRAMRDEWR